MRMVPSFFLTNRIGAPNGDLLGWMKPALTSSVQLLLQLGQLGGAQPDGRTTRRRRPRDEFDAMVHLPRWRQTRRQLFREYIPEGCERATTDSIQLA